MTAASPIIHAPGHGLVSKARVVASGTKKAMQAALQRARSGKVQQTIAGDEKKGPQALSPHPGRPSNVLPGVWVGSELSERKKFIVLGTCCRKKFDEKPHHYVVDHLMKWQGTCDGCRSWRTDMTGFLHQSRMGNAAGTMRAEPE